jgi:hypothetical protein
VDRGLISFLMVLAGVVLCAVAGVLVWAGTSNLNLALELGFFGAAVGFIGVLVGGPRPALP